MMKYRIIFSLFFFQIVLSCTTSQDSSIYIPGSVFKYHVTEINGKDTVNHNIELRVLSDSRFGQTVINYIYSDQINSSGDTLIEATGVIDNKERIFLHPPRKVYMKFAEMAPFPEVSLPLAINKSTKREIDLNVVKGYGELDGLTIKQLLIQDGKREDVIIGGEKFPDCWIMDGENINYVDRFGKFKVRHWFHNKYGFVKMHYTKPDGSTVTLELIK